MRLVVDASVAIKWVVSEAGSPQAIAIRRHELIAPELIFLECCNALWKLSRGNQTAWPAATGSLEALMAVPLTVVPARNLGRRALEIAFLLGHPAYDALYVAMAEVYSAKVVTAEARLLRVVSASPFSHLVINLEDAAAN